MTNAQSQIKKPISSDLVADEKLGKEVTAERWKNYSEYKDSGVDFLGNIPAHWETRRFRFLLHDGYFGLKIGPFGSQIRSDMLVEDGIKIYGQENVINKDFEVGNRFITEEKFQELGIYEIKPGDLLITMMGTSGRCDIVPQQIKPGIMDSHLIRVRTKESLVNRRFFQILIDQANYVQHQIQLLGKGSIMHGLNSSIVKELTFVFPTIGEQEEILSFLHQETERIDELIAKKQRLIELLQEKRTSLISQAITKGLNPNAHMKDSGINWLGLIPAHWEIKPFRRLIRQIDQGWSPVAGNEPAQAEGLGVLKLSAINKGQFLPGQNKVLDIEINDMGKLTPVENDLLISRSNTPDLVGDACVVKQSMPNLFLPDLIYRVKIDCKQSGPLFICYFLLSIPGRAQIKMDARGTSGSMVKLGQGHIRSWKIPLPLIPEQESIIRHLNRETAKIDQLINCVSLAIGKLQEYRSGIISAAVTGKIDVRHLNNNYTNT